VKRVSILSVKERCKGERELARKKLNPFVQAGRRTTNCSNSLAHYHGSSEDHKLSIIQDFQDTWFKNQVFYSGIFHRPE